LPQLGLHVQNATSTAKALVWNSKSKRVSPRESNKMMTINCYITIPMITVGQQEKAEKAKSKLEKSHIWR